MGSGSGGALESQQRDTSSVKNKNRVDTETISDEHMREYECAEEEVSIVLK